VVVIINDLCKSIFCMRQEKDELRAVRDKFLAKLDVEVWRSQMRSQAVVRISGKDGTNELGNDLK